MKRRLTMSNLETVHNFLTSLNFSHILNKAMTTIEARIHIGRDWRYWPAKRQRLRMRREEKTADSWVLVPAELLTIVRERLVDRG